MQTGTTISGLAHIVLIGWAVFAGKFTSDPPPPEVRAVSVITSEQFAALSAPRQTPDVSTALQAPDQPDEPTLPEIERPADKVPERVEPEVTPLPRSGCHA